MPNANKNKGKSFERQVCKVLSEVFGLNFERVFSSGSFVGGQNSWRVNKLSSNQLGQTMGDVSAPSEFNNKLTIECKSRKEFSFNLLFDGSKELNEWLEQTLVDFEKAKCSVFLLIFKPNNKGMFVVYFEKLYIPVEGRNYMKYNYKDHKLVIENFDDKWVLTHKQQLLDECKL